MSYINIPGIQAQKVSDGDEDLSVQRRNKYYHIECMCCEFLSYACDSYRVWFWL